MIRSARTTPSLALFVLSFASFLFATAPGAQGQNHSIAGDQVTWNTLGKNENDSMPIGNGDLAANVWTEQNGDLLLLVAKSDAFTEAGKLVKLGRLRIHLDPALSGGTGFSQTLRLEDGSIEIRSGADRLLVWIDANHPALHVEAHLSRPGSMHAALEDWRLGQGDTLLPAKKDRITWLHFNSSSAYENVLEQEHLSNPAPPIADPLLHRCFGAIMLGPGLVAGSNSELLSDKPAANLRLDLVALTEQGTKSEDAWTRDIAALVPGADPGDLQAAREAHRAWWREFWNRSWIDVSGTEAARSVSQGYAMQRYMMAASSRGELPPKFNGGLFTVGHDLPTGAKSTKEEHDPDWRAWGDSYWNQNERLLYWPLVTTGDYDLLQPWFSMYTRALPVATTRASTYYHHAGALYPETMLFWGLPRLEDFGTHNPTNEIQSRWQRYHIQGALEVAMQMLDYYDATGDEDFARQSLVPFADAVVTFYDRHYPPDAGGRMVLSPAQSLETYQLTATNPTPDIAGLMAVLPRLIALPQQLTTSQQRAAWTTTLKQLPAIPMGRTAQGKTPPLGGGDADGMPVILPAEKYDKPANSENPELYVSFPYRLYGVGKPGLELARATFAARRFPQKTCWGQDGTEGATLGLTAVAEDAVTAEFTSYGDQRFAWFWRPAHDWIPDLDNGGSGMTTLQLMLMQTDGRKILLLPAWPADWAADFKLHAPYQTTVEGHVEGGKLTRLEVTPASRRQDVVVSDGR